MNIVCDTRVHRGTLIQLAVAALLLGGGGAVRTIVPAARLVVDAPLDELRRETVRLRVYDDASAAKAAATLSEMRARLWTPARFEEWRRSLPSRWVLQEAQPQVNASTVTRRFVLTRRAAAARDWSEIHGLLTQINTLPAAVVQRLKLSMLQPQSRQFEDVEVIMDLWFQTEAAPERATESAP